MQITDKAIILQRKLLRENSVIVTALTQNHGIYRGCVKNASGAKSSIYQPGNVVDFNWQARIDDHIGTMRCELIYSNMHFMYNKLKLYALNSIISMIIATLSERICYRYFFEHLYNYTSHAKDSFNFIKYAYLEGALLTEAGYGLDLSICAASGTSQNLAYVSPRSGRAISLEAGLPYRDKLLTLPLCLLNGQEPESIDDYLHISNLFLYFFQRYILGKYEPHARQIFIEYLVKEMRVVRDPK